MISRLELRVDPARCTRCGACVALVPGVFEVSGRTSRVARQPNASEELYAEAARLVCPSDAIRATPATDDVHTVVPGGTPAVVVSGVEAGPLFDELATGAERVRWTLDGLAWSELEVERVPPDLRLVVREMAFSENATYSATQRFLESFYDDVDFSRWVAVWFYEETKHPYVLIEWLRRVGDRLPSDFVVKGRVSTPFMRSKMGTLVTNVISEVTAAQAYRRLSRSAPEPVLARLADLIAGDEARHAASFFRFARRTLAAAPDDGALRDRARGLEVLQAWLGGARPATHPVAQMIDRLGEVDASAGGLDTEATRTRVSCIIGLLLDVPIRRVQDVAPALRDLLVQVRA